MSLSDKAREARDHASGCTNPACHRYAHALAAAELAEFDSIRRADEEPADVSDLPKWSAVSTPGTTEGPLR